ncbi:MAG: NADPH:quinone oxidoreductase family protein [Rhodospirillales bacterium]
MRAVLCKTLGGPDDLVLDEIEPKPLQPGQVRLATAACGVNFPDTLIIAGKYQYKPDLPFSPGGEVSGRVVELARDVTGWREGDEVIAMTGWGGFAEQVVTTPDRLLARPDSMDPVTAAGFAMTYGTTYHALVQRAQLAPGETLLVLGAAGGVGLAAVELGKALGARVIAAASTAEKLAVAKTAGADALIDYSKESLKDATKALTDGKGADVIYDPVGGDLFDQATRAINWKGRLLVVGFASGRIPQFPANLALLKGSSVVGVFWGAFREKEPAVNEENFRQLFKLHAEGKIKPLISETYPLERAGEALTTFIERRAVGKLVLTV